MTSRFAQYGRRSGIPVPDPGNPEKPENRVWSTFGHVVSQMKGLGEPVSNLPKFPDSGSSGSGNPEKPENPDFSFLSIHWRTRLARRVFGVSKEASWPPGSNRIGGPVFPVHPEKPDFLFFSIYWRTILARRVFGVSKERSWPPGSNRMDGPGFPVHPDPEIRKNLIFCFSPFTGEPD